MMRADLSAGMIAVAVWHSDQRVLRAEARAAILWIILNGKRTAGCRRPSPSYAARRWSSLSSNASAAPGSQRSSSSTVPAEAE